MAEITEANIKEFQGKLLNWFNGNGRVFPWRDPGLTDFELIIAEVLLQRTKAETVAKFYLFFINKYPSWSAITKADLTDIEETLKPIGLYRQRSKRLLKLAIEMEKRNGVFPKERRELDTIPFLGQYIGNAVQLLVFNLSMPLIDVNMARVLERYFGERKMADIRYDPYLQDLAATIVAVENPKQLNWAILDFAARICKARKPLCESCFLSSKCRYFKANTLNSREYGFPVE